MGVATDSRDRVFVFDRSEHPVSIFTSGGQFISSWGAGLFKRPHGIFIDHDDAVYCTDDVDHTVRKFTRDGQLLMTLGTSGKGADTGVIDVDYRTIERVGPPFHRPTNLAVAPDGTLLVADGYGNARIHRFAADGTLLHSWGAPGDGPGQFNLPHGIAVHKNGNIVVADRENSRLQIFSPRGDFLDQWTDVERPMEVFVDSHDHVFVAEAGWIAVNFPWQETPDNAVGGRMSVFDGDGTLLARWGGGIDPAAPGDFLAPHDVWLDSQGSLYVSEVVLTAGETSPPFHALQKFIIAETLTGADPHENDLHGTQLL